MTKRRISSLFLFSLFFFAYWFFGNLYEEIVLVPNQLVDTYEALSCWQMYFKITNPVFYYIPFTPLAVVGAFVLHFHAKDERQKKILKRASLFGLTSVLITVIIVTQLNTKLFFGDLEKYKTELFEMSVLWLFANAIRLYTVGSSLYYILQAYILEKQFESNNR